MRPKLSGSVGNKGMNKAADIQVVQELLNKNSQYLIPLKPLAEDGRLTPETTFAIEEFQRRALGQAKPDGRIDPGKATWKKLVSVLPPDQPAHVEAFITLILPAARDVKKKWRVPISVLIAQGALESGWGRHVVDNAYFGIKGKAPDGASATFLTSEVVDGKSVKQTDTFRAYKSVDEAADDYGRFLATNSRYSACFTSVDRPLDFVTALASAGYATDPDYAAKLTSIITRYELERYDQ